MPAAHFASCAPRRGVFASLPVALGAGLAVALAVLGIVPRGEAVTVTGLYEATVPLPDRSERGQAAAFQDAMRQVLVRVTGRREAGAEPALAPLINDARRYVQQYRVVEANQLLVGFDGGKIERQVTEAGQPLWGSQRPRTLVWLAADDGTRRIVVDAQSDSELRLAVERAAALRGLPIAWPAAADRERIGFDDIWNGSMDKLRAAAGRLAVDAILVGRASGSPGGGWQLNWSLLYGEESSQWRGSAEEGTNGAADVFARVFAAATAEDGLDVLITVSGIVDLRAYAAVTDYLESLSLIRSLAVDQLAGDTVIYRARARSDTARLARAIGLSNRLQAVTDAASAAPSGGGLIYRYRP